MSLKIPPKPSNDHPQSEREARAFKKLSPALLTVREACEALRISRWTLYDLIRSRAIETIKIGRSRRIPQASIDAYVRRRLAEDIE
ncbi:helix-turn-helix domain-containing protein [Lentzea tibetensis]|uniref:Helix-turn-helix domain-containing protein n=2 Tax=Lentzea tibetensis TaxID=2591470 RepID=A0A563EHI7_9PSEU|nr:helix-turn-helix domain-containing protein [Lentzea tibetensis]